MNLNFSNVEKKLALMKYTQQENGIRRHHYDEEMKQYVYMKAGNLQGVQESQAMMRRNQAQVCLSNDPVRNIKYLYVACITIVTRFAIEGGLDSDTAYSISDLYINKMDPCRTVEEVLSVHEEMFTFFTQKMIELQKKAVYSKPVIQCIDYINENLHEPIRLTDLAEHVNLSQSHLSRLFLKEVGENITDFILARKITAAKDLLRYSDYSAVEISEILSFSSQSHFINTFKKIEGMTPRNYQQQHTHNYFDAAK